MTRKHFEAAAEIVLVSEAPKNVRKLMANAFIELFRQFNPGFDKERFLSACGLT